MGGRAISEVYWFITVLLLSSVVIAIIENNFQFRPKIAIYVGMYCIAIFLSENILAMYSGEKFPMYLCFPWGIDMCLIAIPYMMIGYRGMDILKEMYNSNRKLYIIVLFISLLLFACM